MAELLHGLDMLTLAEIEDRRLANAANSLRRGAATIDSGLDDIIDAAAEVRELPMSEKIITALKKIEDLRIDLLRYSDDCAAGVRG